MYKRKYIKPEIDISETIVKRSGGGDLTEAKEFVNDWNSKRSEQIHENLQSLGIPFFEDLYKKALKRNVDTVKLADIDIPENALGTYHKLLHKINLNTDNKDTKIHEVAHASRPKAQEAKIRQLKSDGQFLKDGVAPNDYLDSEQEIYARLMSLREELKLDPKKRYSISEIRKMIDKKSKFKIGIPNNKGDFRIVTTNYDGTINSDIGPKHNLNYDNAEVHKITTDKHSIFDRYTPIFIESLINDVADNRKYIPKASLGMSFDIASWWNRLLQNKNDSIQYTPLLEKAVTPKLSLSYPVKYKDSNEDSEQEEVEGEVPYANVHVEQTPQSTTHAPVEEVSTQQNAASTDVSNPGYTPTDRPIIFSSRKDFVNTMIPLYQKALQRKGLDPKYAIALTAQVATESAWGQRPIGYNTNTITNNYIGMKLPTREKGKGKGYVSRTTEHLNGTNVKISDEFRTFDSLEDMIDFHINFLSNERQFPNLFHSDLNSFGEILKKGRYATAPTYASFMNSMINSVQKYIVKAKQGYEALRKKAEVTISPKVRFQTYTPTHNAATSDQIAQNVTVLKQIIAKAKELGLPFVVTSAVRPNAKTKSGNLSRHALGEALDISLVGDNSFEAYEQMWKMFKERGFLDYLSQHGFKVLREYYPEIMARTGAAGKHFHIGKDSTIDTDGFFKTYKPHKIKKGGVLSPEYTTHKSQFR